MTTPAIDTQYGPDVLLIFVGHSEDATEAARTIKDIEPALQEHLEQLRKVSPGIRYRVVKVWEWSEDARSISGGQREVVTPKLARADAVVFPFRERVGEVTRLELEYVRGKSPRIPLLVFFAQSLPEAVLKRDRQATDEWNDLLKFETLLCHDWTDENSNAVRPQERFRDLDQLRAVALAQLRAAVTELAQASVTHPTVTPPAPPPAAKSWTPAVLYPLQPAQHFAGRKELLEELCAWSRDPRDANRVVALIAPGGTGKTAVTERVLDSLRDHTSSGVLVWSFYENQQTEAFLRAACDYFLGEAPKETGGLFEKLQHGLRVDSLPHLMILDGLELVQATGSAGRPRGELEDPVLRRFLKWVAAGMGTQLKALVTSRFPMPDLEDWLERGYRPVELEDLDPLAARALLRRRGVNGTDRKLDDLVERVHRHALTVDVLGLHIARFGEGDPANAPKIDLRSAKSNRKGERLVKVLESYAAKLPNDERDLLARVSLFPRGVSVEEIGCVSENPATAGALHGYDRDRFRGMFESLRDLGLVFRSDDREAQRYSAHPFLRDFFRTLIGATKPEEVHEAVRRKLFSTYSGRRRLQSILMERPGQLPTTTEELQSVEQIIEATRLAGRFDYAYELFEYTLGGYLNLGGSLGNFSLGLRILASFAADGDPERLPPSLAPLVRARLLNQWGLFATPLGDLKTGELCFERAQSVASEEGDKALDVSALTHLVKVRQLGGRFPAALKAARELLHKEPTSKALAWEPLVYVATSLGGLGKTRDALTCFAQAEHGNGGQLDSIYGLWEGEFLLSLGRTEEAIRKAEKNVVYCRNTRRIRNLAMLDALLARLYAPTDRAKAREHLEAARKFAEASSNLEIQLPCYLAASEIALLDGRFEEARSEALAGTHVADTFGFGQFSIDLRCQLAAAYLQAGRAKEAIEPATWAVQRASREECQYAWGVADSLHLLGVAHARSGDRTAARDYLQRAKLSRTHLQHPGLAETEAESANLG